ncbi:MAG: tRNA pseudouridine(13) synthase TruD [Phycisphaerae bacterium]|nr:tRNA pseudouridine(13) synthase TruD [Tepidisphaeraceae bacterium]
MPLPYLTKDFPGIGGTLKARPEDFAVQELPIYEPSGAGEHVFCEIQKTGVSTFDAIGLIANALNVPQKNIGYAGLKDAHAVTRQHLSIWGTTPEKVQALKIENVAVLWADRHVNKLRMGHLKGNAFAIKVRDVAPTDVVKVKPVLDELVRRGVPNYFGEQRFGRRGDNHILGAAVIRQDYPEMLNQLLGRPNPATDDAQQLGARKAVDENDFSRAMKIWPRSAGMERRVLHRLIKSGKAKVAARGIDERIKRLWVSALQSKIFNDVVAARVEKGLHDKLLLGDFAIKHENGAGFMVEDPAIEQPRCDAFEISPTAPLVGYRVTLPTGEPLKMEEAAFAAVGLRPGDFRREGGERVKGTRRAARVRPTDVDIAGGVDEHGPFILFKFTLPAGSFATVLLAELMKPAGKGKAAEEEETEEAEEAEPSTHPLGSAAADVDEEE